MSAAVSPFAPVPVPKELGAVPPGAVLTGLLEDIDIEHVSGLDTVEVLLAEHRLTCRQQARFLRAVLETGLRRPFSVSTVERVERPGEFAAEEARAALVWSRTRAERTFAFATDLFLRLPLLGESMLAGDIDEPRARAFVDWTAGLTDEQAHRVCEQLLPTAGRLTVGELIDRIKRACLAIDPAWAEKTYREAVKTRRVRGCLTPDGTGTLAGYSQPAERVVAACERIDTLARACKRAGDRRKIDLIRSDLYLGMTDGTFEGLAEHEIIDYVLAHPYTVPGEEDGEGAGKDTDGGGTDGGGTDGGGTDDNGPGADGRSHAANIPDPADRGANCPHPGSGGPGGGSCASMPPEPIEPAEPAEPGVSAVASVGATHAGTSQPATRAWAVPELRVQLGTLLGLNSEPAEVPGWGYVPAWLARHLVARTHDAEWRYVICDGDGRVVYGGLITALPNGAGARRNTRRGGIVELAYRPRELAQPIAGLGPAASTWAPVLEQLARVVAGSGGARQADGRDPTRRTAGAALRRWIQQRDRRCVHPCCRVPASKADQDHRIGFAHGGPTAEGNLSAPCR
ncbi:MAG TPA: HNH endonuclease signature motif containing protein, partial [Jiangellaceae bacterium]|nr:HNH endonuclease signature motif containing protein [Jiangellaceae bacterium]